MLGVSSLARVPSASDISTIAEAGVADFEAVGWVMIVAPANTPKAVVEKLHSEFKTIVAMPDTRSHMIKLGTIPLDSPPPAQQQQFINSEIARWATVVQQAGIAGSE